MVFIAGACRPGDFFVSRTGVRQSGRWVVFYGSLGGLGAGFYFPSFLGQSPQGLVPIIQAEVIRSFHPGLKRHMKDRETVKNSRAVIFAEGGDPRLRPLTEHLPTSLVPIGGTPILDHQVQTLLRNGVSDITVIGGYRAAQVEQACRPYAAVGFRFNPHFSRTEPCLTSFQACGLPGDGPNIFLRGDVIFDGALVDRILNRAGSDLVVREGDRPIGIYSLTQETANDVFARGAEALAAGRSDQEIFPFLEAQLVRIPHENLEVGDLPWARVATMEDLARALKIHKALRGGQTTPNLVGLNKRVPTVAKQPVGRASVGSPAPASSLEPDSEITPLPRPLLKVMHR